MQYKVNVKFMSCHTDNVLTNQNILMSHFNWNMPF